MLQYILPVKAFTASRQLLCWYGRPNGKLIVSKESFKVSLSLIKPTVDLIILLLEMVTQCPCLRETTEAFRANNVDLVILYDCKKSYKLPFQTGHHRRERARSAEVTIWLSSPRIIYRAWGCFRPRHDPIDWSWARLILTWRGFINIPSIVW